MNRIQYPIGRFEPVLNQTTEQRNQLMNEFPQLIISLRDTVHNLKEEQLHIPYRPDGWTTQQIVHHMADNDMNAYIRFKRALTEAEPIASSYREDLWAELPDYCDVPIETSLVLIEMLHARFHALLQQLSPDDFSRKLSTQKLGLVPLDIALQAFVWHSKHHTAQIESLMQRLG